jgi:hypothetical protein
MIIMTDQFTPKNITTRLFKTSVSHLLLPLRFAVALLILMGVTNRSSAQTYCTPSGAGDTWSILSVSTTGGTTNISNLASGYSVGGYGNFTTMTVTATAGGSFTITAVAGALTSFTYKWAVWIDYNNDGDFDDANETAYTYLLSTGINTMTTSITVWSGATAGNKRLRIRNLRDYNTDVLGPCGALPGNETEDYTLVVTSSIPVTCAAPTAANATSVTATSASLNWTQTGTPPQWQIKYGPTGFNVNTAGISIFTPTKPYALTGLSSATTYDYYVRAVCGANDTSLWSPVVVFTTLTAPITCPAPTAPNATTITQTSAILNWTQTGTPPQWQIKYGAPGFNPNTAGTSIFTPTKPYTLNPPLSSFTSYDFYVRAVCGASDTSFWSPVTNFTTLCNAPTVASKKDSFNCGTGTVTLQATSSGSGSIKWYANLTGGAALATGTSFTTPSISATTTYYIAAASGTCESSPRTAVVASIRTVPTVNIGNDTTICPGISYVLNATTSNATYAWNNSATTPTITVNAAGTYSVLVTVNGCSGSDARIITPGVAPVNNLVPVTNLCAGETVTLNAGNTGSSFLWTPGSAITQTINVTAGGNYSVVVKSINGCKITSTTNVVIRPLPVANLGNDTSICEGDQITLNAGNPGYAYLWNTGATSQTIAVIDSGTYKVTVTSPYNCETIDEKHVAFQSAPRVEGFNFIPLFYEELGKVKFSPLNPTHVDSYKWDFGDGTPTTTQMNPLHVYPAGGFYNVSLTVYNGCSEFTISLMINVDLATGMVTLNKDQADVTIYPNPSSNIISIDQHSDAVKMETVMVYNALGALVYEGKVTNNKHHELSVAGFASGMYSVRIVTDKGYINRKIVVKR